MCDGVAVGEVVRDEVAAGEVVAAEVALSVQDAELDTVSEDDVVVVGRGVPTELIDSEDVAVVVGSAVPTQLMDTDALAEKLVELEAEATT